MSETATRDTVRESVERGELRLRQERARIGAQIASAARKVQVLRAEGHKGGSAELEAALGVVAELVNREAQLPAEILDCAAERVAEEARRLRQEEAERAQSSSPLHDEQATALKELRQAEKRLARAQEALEANMLQREALAREARMREAFCSRAREASESGDPKRIGRVLEDALHDGWIPPLHVERASPARE
jgi:hypothetical protein